MKGAQLSFSPELIRSALNIDDTYDIIDARFDSATRSVILIVTGPDLPIVEEGAIYPSAHLEDILDAPAPTYRHRHIIPD